MPAVLVRGLIGVVHLKPLPGDAGAAPDASFDRVFDAALADAHSLSSGGAAAVIVENYGSAPFHKGTREDPVPSHQVAMLARVAQACAGDIDLPVGINCLRNGGPTAVGIAAAVGADFVRINVHTGAYVTDQGLIEGEAAHTMGYRTRLDAQHVAVLADVLVKHARPLSTLEPEDVVGDTLHRGRADGLIVTGATTGAAIDVERLRRVRAAAGDAPVYLGSGVTRSNAAQLAPFAEGAIVGTSVKQGGIIHAPVDAGRVAALATELCAHLRR